MYRQGMTLPGHPNNTGTRPLIIGMPRCVDDLAEYIHLGNYGLTERAELIDGGLDEAAADEMLKIKRLFAFGAFKKTEELLTLIRIEAPIVELRGGLFLRRSAPDRYEFILDGESILIDLSLIDDEESGAPYALPKVSVSKDRFSVIHIGEGDGWDPSRPCMGSLLSAGGGLWLVDAGPNIEYSLRAIGFALSDITGVFNSHIHDDHFLGLASLFRCERKLLYCAVPCVRRAAARKLAALARIDEEEFGMYFDVRDLIADEWNDFRGFAVQPIIAPHPVENTLFKFKATGPEGTRIYAHWADLTSFAVLDSMSAAKHGLNGISDPELARIKNRYLESADLKKLDVGGGMIHGEAKDFATDQSVEILLSHTSAPISDLSFARTAEFGETSVLIAGKAETEESPNRMEAEAGGYRAPLPSPSFFDGIESTARILSVAKETKFGLNDVISESAVYFVISGSLTLHASGKVIETIESGGIAGLESIFSTAEHVFTTTAASQTIALRIEPKDFARIPALLWRARELQTERLLRAEKALPFVWRAGYDMNVPNIDAGHRKLFDRIEQLCEEENPDEKKACRESLRAAMVEHFTVEEGMMSAAGYPWLREHQRLHEKLLAEFTAEPTLGDLEYIRAEFKDCFIRHTLIADRRYLPWLNRKE
ncbi:MAG: hemerythrin domain-containing protein, partial [Treponemataceae bacterium]